jgi:carbonic anhydrase/acetyltransferase-like protein (isoleucine patch superfamily)
MSTLLRLSNRYRVAIALVGSVVASAAGVQAVAAAGPSFIDSTAYLINPQEVHFGALVYVAPFALLKAGTDAAHAIRIGSETNIQDSVTVDASSGAVTLGEQVSLAHGAAVKGHAEIGETGVCPGKAAHCPSFVGFNALVDHGNVEKDAMVLHLARVGAGVTIPSGCKVLSGKNLTTQAQVGVPPACNPPFTAPVTEADRAFMAGVIEVNVCFAEQYTALAAADPDNVRGINFDPDCPFNPGKQLPTIHGVPTRAPEFRNRIIGDVRTLDDLPTLNEVMGNKISLRADEGFPFEVGSILQMDDRTTFHALEHTHLQLGNNGRYGFHSLVHGGPADFDPTQTGDDFILGKEAVFFRSKAGVHVTVGCRSLVQQSNLANDTTVPNFTVMISNEVVGTVEWGTCPPPAALENDDSND